MVSTELIRRYPFFSNFTEEELKAIAMTGNELTVEAGTILFRRTDRVASLFLILEGEIDIMLDVTARDVVHELSDQLAGTVKTEDIVVSTAIPGEICSWSSLIPPFAATAAGRAATDLRMVDFDAAELLQRFEEDPRLGYKVTQKIAQVIQDRLQDRRMELLSQLANHVH
jgi:CRP-like cAMP-binding protein